MLLFKKSIVYIMVFSMLLVSSATVNAKRSRHADHNTRIGFDGITVDNINIDFDDEILTVTNTDDKTSFSINKKYELYINDVLVKTTSDQKKLTKEMYRSIDLIIEEAKEIGWDGAKIGVEGAKLGLHAVMCVFKLLSPDYDSDDLENEIERKAKKIERKADKLELRAEHIEDMARELEDISDRMLIAIPELKELTWF